MYIGKKISFNTPTLNPTVKLAFERIYAIEPQLTNITYLGILMSQHLYEIDNPMCYKTSVEAFVHNTLTLDTMSNIAMLTDMTSGAIVYRVLGDTWSYVQALCDHLRNDTIFMQYATMCSGYNLFLKFDEMGHNLICNIEELN